MGLLERVEVFTLNVFNQGHRCRSLVGHVPNQHGNFIQTCQTRSTESSFASNDFIFARVGTITQLANQNRLHDALGFDGLCQLIQRAFVHPCSRLIHARHQLTQGQCGGRAVGCRFNRLRRAGFALNFGPQKGFKPTTQTFRFFSDHLLFLS